MRKPSPVLTAILGILVGALLVMVFDSVSSRNRRLRAEFLDWRKLNLILQTVDENYVDSIDYENVSIAAVNAALQELDPHSIYLPPAELEESENDLAGQFEGIGIMFNVPSDTATVLEVIAGGPSEKAGLRVGDRIVKVDDKVIAGVGFPQDSMVRRMKGPAGTRVLITVRRDGEVIPFNITRGRIATHSVDASFMVDDTTAYLRLSKFARTTYPEVVQALSDLSGHGMKKLVFDIRGNSGGFFDQALLLSNLFLEKGDSIVYMEGRHRKRESYVADGRGIFKDIGLVVLIDEGTASSSEIFSGAMQDNRRAVIVGRRSFGKGLVQEPMYFTDGSGVRITVARFFTPSGRCLQKPYSDDYDYEVFHRYGTGEMVSADSMKAEMGGILPDVFVPLDTTAASSFHKDCYRKATVVRFASWYFDNYKADFQDIDDYDDLIAYLDSVNLEEKFLFFARTRDGLVLKPSDMKDFRRYTMTQVRSSVSRYSKLGDKAYYHLFLSSDQVFSKAMEIR